MSETTAPTPKALRRAAHEVEVERKRRLAVTADDVVAHLRAALADLPAPDAAFVLGLVVDRVNAFRAAVRE